MTNPIQQLRKHLEEKRAELLTRADEISRTLLAITDVEAKPATIVSSVNREVERVTEEFKLTSPEPKKPPKYRKYRRDMTLLQAYGIALSDGNWHSGAEIAKSMTASCGVTVDGNTASKARYSYIKSNNGMKVLTKEIEGVVFYKAQSDADPQPKFIGEV